MTRVTTAEATVAALLAELAAPVVTYNGPLTQPWTTRKCTADDVAARLLMLGCLGQRYMCGLCPVSTYLSRHGCDVRVFPLAVMVPGHGNVAVPEPIADCVDAIDRYRYPELLKSVVVGTPSWASWPRRRLSENESERMTP